jgi:hypothetical protein
MKFTCSCGATAEFPDTISGAVNAGNWRDDHANCHSEAHDELRMLLQRVRSRCEGAHRAFDDHELRQEFADLRDLIDKRFAALDENLRLRALLQEASDNWVPHTTTLSGAIVDALRRK